MQNQYGHVVIGAGLVGLATAREKKARRPDLTVAVVEKEQSAARHQGGHNAGVYYKPVPVKVRLRVEGETVMGRFDDEHGNAVLATKREGYRRTGAEEVWRDVVKAAFVRDLQRYVPDVRPDQLVFGPSGVRAQAVGPNGPSVDDSTLAVTQHSMHVLNAPSPAATASLAITTRVADAADAASDLKVPQPVGSAPSHGS